MRKPLAAAPPLLQRMILQLQQYDITITHKPGKQIPVADTLSRKPIECSESLLSEDIDWQIHTVVRNAPVSDNKLAEIRVATVQDKQFSVLKQVITSGWPESHKKCPPANSSILESQGRDIRAKPHSAKRRKNHCAPLTQSGHAFTHSHRTLGDRKMQAVSKRRTLLAWNGKTNRGVGRILQHLPGGTQLCPKGADDITPYSNATLASDRHRSVHVEQYRLHRCCRLLQQIF